MHCDPKRCNNGLDIRADYWLARRKARRLCRRSLYEHRLKSAQFAATCKHMPKRQKNAQAQKQGKNGTCGCFCNVPSERFHICFSTRCSPVLDFSRPHCTAHSNRYSFSIDSRTLRGQDLIWNKMLARQNSAGILASAQIKKRQREKHRHHHIRRRLRRP